MTQAFVAKAPPLVADEEGVIRVAGTRVQLEVIVLAFDAGATVEEIVQQYSSLELADVYSVISYLLGNEAVVRDYVAQRVASPNALRIEIERSSATGRHSSALAQKRRRSTRSYATTSRRSTRRWQQC